MLEVFLPLKALHGAKSRLQPVLRSEARRRLVQAMAADLLAVIAPQPCIANVHVIVGDGWDLESPISDHRTVRMLRESDLGGSDLNAILTRAVAAVRPQRGLLIHGDLPCLAPSDMQALVQALDAADAVLCPDARRRGTNAIAFRAGRMPRLCFGQSSFKEHRRELLHKGRNTRILARTGLARDIDIPADLNWLRQQLEEGAPVGEHTRGWLAQYQSAPLAAARAALLQTSGGHA